MSIKPLFSNNDFTLQQECANCSTSKYEQKMLPIKIYPAAHGCTAINLCLHFPLHIQSISQYSGRHLFEKRLNCPVLASKQNGLIGHLCLHCDCDQDMLTCLAPRVPAKTCQHRHIRLEWRGLTHWPVKVPLKSPGQVYPDECKAP